MSRLSVLALLSLLASGCATTGLSARFVGPEVLAYDKAKYPDDAAVVLYRADKTRLDTSGEDFTHVLRHAVVAVQGEGGLDLAEVRVPFGSTEKLVDFIARVIQPDGSTVELDAKSLLSDTNGEGERDSNAHFFRFPDVRVGSVLEYAYVIESPYIWNQDNQDTLGSFPVRQYEFELTASKPLVLETIELNSRSPIEVRTRPNDDHQLYFQLRDLPPRDEEDWAPHWTFTEPRWAWRVVAYKANAITYDWIRDWDDVVERRGEAFFVDKKLYQGFDERVDFTGCADVACKVQRAQALVREKTNAAASWSREKPLAQVWKSGQASLTERALMLKKLLEDGGVEVWLAYGTDKASQQRTPTFPLWSQFDHLFVYLPRQPGLDAPMPIDPACQFCAPGTLTARHRGIPLFVFRTASVLGGVDTEGRWATAVAEPATPASTLRVTHRAQVQADGAVRDAVAFEALGHEAVSRSRSQPGEQKALRQAREAARRVSSLATVDTARFGPCVAQQAECRWSAERHLPATAVSDGDRWLVSAAALEPHADQLFDAAQRKQDVHFQGDDFTFEEVLELEAPPGFRLATPPAPVSAECAAMSASVKVEPTEQGARLTRRLTRRVGEWPKTLYPELRKVAAVFKDARRHLLVFEKR
jgi:hypothetical protein